MACPSIDASNEGKNDAKTRQGRAGQARGGNGMSIERRKDKTRKDNTKKSRPSFLYLIFLPARRRAAAPRWETRRGGCAPSAPDDIVIDFVWVFVDGVVSALMLILSFWGGRGGGCDGCASVAWQRRDSQAGPLISFHQPAQTPRTDAQTHTHIHTHKHTHAQTPDAIRTKL